MAAPPITVRIVRLGAKEFPRAEIRMTGADGRPLTRWDGLSYKPSPITGEPVPDEACQVEQLRYLAPRKH